MSTALLVMWMWAAQGQTVPHTDITGNFTARSIQIDHGKVVSVEHACITRYEDGALVYNECDPADVPAVRGTDIHYKLHDAMLKWPKIERVRWCHWNVGEYDEKTISCVGEVWTCSDKSRVLLTSEDGAKHCIKFGVR